MREFGGHNTYFGKLSQQGPANSGDTIPISGSCLSKGPAIKYCVLRIPPRIPPAYAAEVHFNATAPRRPTRTEYRDIIAEALG